MTIVPQKSDGAPFWDALEAGELRLPFCNECGEPHLPPGPVCPYCLSSALEWRQASGKAKLSSWVVERNKWFEAFDPPYIVGEVQLGEGPRMPVQIAWDDLERLKIDSPGRIVLRLAENGMMLPQFQPDGSASGA